MSRPRNALPRVLAFSEEHYFHAGTVGAAKREELSLPASHQVLGRATLFGDAVRVLLLIRASRLQPLSALRWHTAGMLLPAPIPNGPESDW